MGNYKFNFQNSLAFFLAAVACFYLFFYPGKNTHLEKLSTPEQINAAIQLASNDAQIRTFAIALVMLIGTYYFGSSKSSQAKDATLQTIASGDNTTTNSITTDVIKTDKIQNQDGAPVELKSDATIGVKKTDISEPELD